jgi:hypothetical protein
MPTNVRRLAGIADIGQAGMQQRCFYQKGGGVDRWKQLGGRAFGLRRKMRNAYVLVDNYEPAMRSSCSDSAGGCSSDRHQGASQTGSRSRAQSEPTVGRTL